MNLRCPMLSEFFTRELRLYNKDFPFIFSDREKILTFCGGSELSQRFVIILPSFRECRFLEGTRFSDQ